MWHANSLIQNLNSDHHVHFLQHWPLLHKHLLYYIIYNDVKLETCHVDDLHTSTLSSSGLEDMKNKSLVIVGYKVTTILALFVAYTTL